MSFLGPLWEGIVGNVLTDFLSRNPKVKHLLLILSVASVVKAVFPGLEGVPALGPSTYLGVGSIGLLIAGLASLPRPVTSEEWEAQGARFRDLKAVCFAQFYVFPRRPWKDHLTTNFTIKTGQQPDADLFIDECTRAASLLARAIGRPLGRIAPGGLPHQWMWVVFRFAESHDAEQNGEKIRYAIVDNLVTLSAHACVRFSRHEHEADMLPFFRKLANKPKTFPMIAIKRRWKKRNRFGTQPRFLYALWRAYRRRNSF